MSDQDKPTAGEWTPMLVADLVEKGRLTKGGNGWKLVADAHNAALAEREREQLEAQEYFNRELANSKRWSDALGEQNLEFEQQLAAERENSINVVREITLEHAEQSGRQIKEIRELRSQLAADREKAEKVYADCAERIVELEAQIEPLRNLLKKVEPFVEAWAMEDLLGEIREELMKQ